MYIPVHTVPTILFDPKKIFMDPPGFVVDRFLSSLRSALFLATYVANFKMTTCTIRNLVLDDPWWAPCLGGVASGLSILIEPDRRRGELALYVVPRALQGVMRMFRKKSWLGRLLRWKWFAVFNFQLATALWMYILALNGWKRPVNKLNRSVLKKIFGKPKNNIGFAIST